MLAVISSAYEIREIAADPVERVGIAVAVVDVVESPSMVRPWRVRVVRQALTEYWPRPAVVPALRSDRRPLQLVVARTTFDQ